MAVSEGRILLSTQTSLLKISNQLETINSHNFGNGRVIMKLVVSALLAQTAVAFVPLSASRPKSSELRMAADGVLNKYSRYDTTSVVVISM